MNELNFVRQKEYKSRRLLLVFVFLFTFWDTKQASFRSNTLQAFRPVVSTSRQSLKVTKSRFGLLLRSFKMLFSPFCVA